MKVTCEIKQALFSYLRTAAVAVASAVVTLNGDIFNAEGVRSIILALAIAIAGPAARALNPNDDAFGKSKKDNETA